MNKFIIEDNFLAYLKEQMNNELIKEAEPFIEKAVVDFEKQLRRRLAEMLISMIDQSYSVDNMGKDLKITIKRV